MEKAAETRLLYQASLLGIDEQLVLGDCMSQEDKKTGLPLG